MGMRMRKAREGAVTEEAQGRQGRNEPQVPESESSPGAEPRVLNVPDRGACVDIWPVRDCER